MFRRVLIANRGEIAVRIAATLQQMGITVVAVFSDADRESPHVGCADEAYPLEGVTAAETYLRGDKIIEIARDHRVDAIHPGYGFLSENAAFAQACADASIAFIGPRPQAIRALGDKIAAKQTMAGAGVPVVPGWAGEADAAPKTFGREAKRIGFPVLVKAAAGGGGKGMRVVAKESELEAAMDSARREAKAAFGDPRVFLEKYIARPRHVEFQIFGDAHGNVVHMYERECSIQRRHQKIIEETPSPALTPLLRERMGEAAVRVASVAGYMNAGTVEFLVDESGGFYFLEVNTRLQVEHPITEMTLRQDLVRAQVLVAAGERLPFTQAELRPEGHALECRIYAEDPPNGFLPSSGTLNRFAPPFGPNVRVDSGVMESNDVSVHYDPMLAKVVTWGGYREDSIARMQWALHRFAILGLTTNVEFLSSLLVHPEFRAGRLHTHFLEENPMDVGKPEVPDEVFVAAAMFTSPVSGEGVYDPICGDSSEPGSSPWNASEGWRTA